MTVTNTLTSIFIESLINFGGVGGLISTFDNSYIGFKGHNLLPVIIVFFSTFGCDPLMSFVVRLNSGRSNSKPYKDVTKV